MLPLFKKLHTDQIRNAQDFLILFSFILPLVYWIYLAFATSMNVRFDAEGFEKLAYIIYKEGWPSFFKQSPDQSPLYPLLVSISMRIADILALSYQKIQTVFQILMFLTTQILLLIILNSLNIKKEITSIILLYFGFSPALVNTVFSLFCEIVTLPLVLCLILCTTKIWNLVLNKNRFLMLMLYSAILGILFFLLTCLRAIYEYVLFFYILSFLLISIKFLIGVQPRKLLKNALFLIILFSVFELLITPYKLMNYKYNGHKATVIVGSSAVYSTSVGRTREITPNQLLMAVSLIPGKGFCHKFYGEKCEFWYYEMHELGLKKVEELKKAGIPNEEHNAILLKEARQHILNKPFQYALLNAMESVKMFFWESSMIGFVFYPDWLTKIFTNSIFKDGLRSIVGILTIYCFFKNFFVFLRKSDIYEPSSAESILIFSIFIIITSNILLHSFFITGPRYALPFAPLHLILIALTIQKLPTPKK